MSLKELLGVVSNESYANEGLELSLEDQMLAEIALESEIDNATFDAIAFESIAALDVVENVMVAMAEKDCTREGANATAVYESYGMEAAKDVLARKAYAGWAAIKALVSTLIGWLKKLFGLSVNMKKVGKSLSEKAKKMRKEANKVVSKVGQKGEIEYEIKDYEWDPTFNTTLKNIEAGLDEIAKITTVADLTTKSITPQTPEDFTKAIEKLDEEAKKWLDETSEKKNMEIYNMLVKGLDVLVDNKTAFPDFDKKVDKALKALEKLYKEIDKMPNTNPQAIDTARKTVGDAIISVNQTHTVVKKTAKFYVTYADHLFTDVKKFIAKAM